MTAVKYTKSAGKPMVERFWSVPFTPATSFITDISTWFVRDQDGWLSTAAWLSLLGTLSVPAPSARTALHRMTKGAYLQRESRNGRPGYSLSDSFCEWIDDFGDVNEEDGSTDLAYEWVMVTFTIPEVRRSERHVMRTILGTLGFASLGNGIWIASGARLAEAQQAIDGADFGEYVEIFLAKHQGFSGTDELIQRCWDVDQLASRYRDFTRDVQARLTRKPAANGRTFADVILTMNSWRRINIDDPRLPISALPRGWPRGKAKDARDKLLARFYGPSRDYVASLEN